MNVYPQYMRDKIISLYNKGNYQYKDLSELFGISTRTIGIWMKEYRLTGECKVPTNPNEGRKRLFDDKQAVLDYLAKNPDASGIDIRDNVAPGIKIDSFYNMLHRMGITFKKKRYSISKETNTKG